MIKHFFYFEIPIWKNKKLEFDFYIHGNDSKSLLCLTIWHVKKLVDICGYEDEWGTNKWHHYKLIDWRKKSNKNLV